MAITIKDVEYVAKLSRLGITDQEKNKFTNQLDAILGYINKLNELNTDNVFPNVNFLNKDNVLREDVVKVFNDKNKILNNAPEREEDFFKVKKVIE